MAEKDKPKTTSQPQFTVEAVTEEEKEWLKFYAEEQLKTPARYEEVAKYLTGIISICLTIFIDKKPPNLQWWTIDALTLASLFWVVAAVITFIVLFPMQYRYNDQSPESIKEMHMRIITRKRNLLIASVVFFVAGLVISIYTFQKGYTFLPIPTNQ